MFKGLVTPTILKWHLCVHVLAQNLGNARQTTITHTAVGTCRVTLYPDTHFIRLRFIRLRFIRLRFIRSRFIRLRFIRSRFIRSRFYPVTLYPASFYPVTLYPVTLYPVTLYPASFYPVMLYPASYFIRSRPSIRGVNWQPRGAPLLYYVRSQPAERVWTLQSSRREYFEKTLRSPFLAWQSDLRTQYRRSESRRGG